MFLYYNLVSMKYLDQDISKYFSGSMKELILNSLPKTVRYIDANPPTPLEEAKKLTKVLKLIIEFK